MPKLSSLTWSASMVKRVCAIWREALERQPLTGRDTIFHYDWRIFQKILDTGIHEWG